MIANDDCETPEEASAELETADVVPTAPPTVSNSWWRRSTPRRLLRIMVGVNEDLAHGNAFKDLVLANMKMQVRINQRLMLDSQEIARLLGIPPDGDFAQACSVNERLSFYEEFAEVLKSLRRRLMTHKATEMVAGNGRGQGDAPPADGPKIHLLKPIADAKDAMPRIEDVPGRDSE